MRTFKLFIISCIALLGLVSAQLSGQTKSEKEAQILKLLDSKNFVFIAESATPMSGGTIRLTSNYQVSFQKDSLNSFLPYFGRAFRAQFGSTESPLSFSSSDFTYEAKNSKKGGRTITVKLTKPDDPDILSLSISPSGYGTLQVISTNRQPISFYGTIEAPQQNIRKQSRNK